MARKMINPTNRTASGTQKCTSLNMTIHHLPLVLLSVRFLLIMSCGPNDADYHNHSWRLGKQDSTMRIHGQKIADRGYR